MTKKRDILILGKGPTKGLEHKLSAEKMYSINFTENNKTFFLSLHYNKENSYFANGTKVIKFKSKEIQKHRNSPIFIMLRKYFKRLVSR